MRKKEKERITITPRPPNTATPTSLNNITMPTKKKLLIQSLKFEFLIDHFVCKCCNSILEICKGLLHTICKNGIEKGNLPISQ